MNELLLTAIRFGFLGLLWVFLIMVVTVLRRDLRAAASTGGASTTGTRRERRERAASQRGQRNQAKSLEILDGPLAGATMALTGADVTIGRAPDCSIVLTDDYASSKHTRLRRVDDTWFVEDLESTNGTWVNRKRITAATAVSAGTVISVGRTSFKVTS
ncbi:MAG: FHA domain-containing protein [Actinobacteria bacterium]|nr:FHA domain-containing protein [Actinomycetota bacterium]